MALLKTINLQGLGKKYQGKVRDFYIVGDKRILITTDRISSFDRILGFIPHKGQVLNQLSAFWFDQTRDIIPNHVISVPDPNVMITKNCRPYPIEMVVRGYITGVTITSLWYNYAQGKRQIYGLTFPPGLNKNQKLPRPVITPTTRGTGAGGHDERISRQEIIDRRIVPEDVYRHMETASLALFKRGSQIANQAGLILVDTKYEFGDYQGELTLIDEIHTPDSSRYWIKATYPQKFHHGQEPENFDKEFFRLWYATRGYRGDGIPPQMPHSYRLKVSHRYLQLYHHLTGKKFHPYPGSLLPRIKNNLAPLLDQVVIIAGSQQDEPFVKKIEQALSQLKLSYRSFYASAHKEPHQLLSLIEPYVKLKHKVVFITVAGRSNALSGFVAGNSPFPVIACPPFKDKHDYLINIHSTLQMPSQVPVLTVIDPANAALAAYRILN